RDDLAARLVAVPPGARPAWSGSAQALLRAHGIAPGPLALRQVAEHNSRALHRPFVHLAARGSFHGMSARALSLTDDEVRRFGRGPRMAGVRFVDHADPAGLARAFNALRGTLLRVRARGRGWEVAALPWLPVASVFFEPIQGEGGIHPMPPE